MKKFNDYLEAAYKKAPESSADIAKEGLMRYLKKVDDDDLLAIASLAGVKFDIDAPDFDKIYDDTLEAINDMSPRRLVNLYNEIRLF